MRAALRRLFRLSPASLTLGITLLVILLYLPGVPILDLTELKTYDLRFRSRGQLQPTPAVALALIDEKSLDVEGRWPWPRSRIAALVDALSRDGAKVIGFDIGFLEPDENSELRLLDQLARTVGSLGLDNRALADFLAERRRRADNDVALAEAIKRSAAAVVLGYFFHMSEADLNYRIQPDELDRQLKRIAASKYPLVRYTEPGIDVVPVPTAYAPESNLDLLSEAAAASGYFSVVSDRDGVVRWIPLVIQAGEDLYPPLALLSAWHYLDRPQLMLRIGRYGVEEVRMGDRSIPTDESGRLLINYLGPPKTFPHFSISDILHGHVAPGTFKDRIVLVGATAMGTHDLRTTPLSPVYPGVEIHATVIDNVLTQAFLTRPDWSSIFDLVAIVVLSVLVGLALPRLSAVKGLAFASALFALHIVVARWLFVDAGAWLNIVYPLLALTANYTALTTYDYVVEERERRKIKDAFRHYVPPLVVEEMTREPQRLTLGGQEKVLTVLFSDLEGFTTYSERYPPHEMVGILSDYYERVTAQVFAHRGTLKEYVADELMAFFGAPIEHPDHAERACAAALAMQEARRQLCAEWAQIGRPLLQARTGINSGPMLVGNLGSKFRFAYGVLGDQVNLGSRLEGLNRVYGTEILIGENTAQLLNGAFLLREVDMVRVKGKQQAVRIYELLARSGTALPQEQEKALGCYAAGLEAYRRQRWTEALELFTEALALWADGPARAMVERCHAYREAPPPDGWDGAFEQLHK